MKWRGDKIAFEVYGTSHAPEVGVIASGVPDLPWDEAALRRFLERRRAKNTAYSTKRIEADVPVIERKGEELRAVIRNENVRSGDYSELYGIPRPSHADYAAHLMDGRLDFSGGGEFSGRLTAPLCVLGGIAKEILRGAGVTVSAWVSEIGGVKGVSYKDGPTEADILSIATCDMFIYVGGESDKWVEDALKKSTNKGMVIIDLLEVLGDAAKEEEMLAVIEKAAAEKDSVGGRVECSVIGLAGAVGGGSFGSLEGKIASLLYLVPAVKAVEFGLGFGFASAFGSEANDPLRMENGEVLIVKNDAGGINGGLSNGNPVTLGVAIRPTPSIGRKQDSVDLVKKKNAEIEIKGRHDACIVPRVVPVVEAAVAIAVLDAMLEGGRL